MIEFNAVFNISMRVASFVFIIIPLLLYEKLGVLPAVVFSVSFLALFFYLVIIPYIAKQEVSNLRNETYFRRLTLTASLRAKKLPQEIQEKRSFCLGLFVILFLVGLFLFATSHSF